MENRLTQQPTFATETITVANQYAAMRHQHEEGREEIRRRHEAIEAARIEQVKSETRSESRIAMQQHEDNCRLERERLKNRFTASLAADDLSAPTRNPEEAVEPQEPRGTIDDTRIDGSAPQDQSHAPHQASDVEFSDSDFAYTTTMSRCYFCREMSFVDSNGCCLECLLK